MKPLATAALLLAAAFAAGADDAESQIALLADDSFQKREAAQTLLIETGESCINQLKTALNTSADEEQRSRIELILKRIAEEAVVGATRITLNLENAPLEEAVDAINKQSKRHLLMFPRDLFPSDSGPTVTLRLTRQPLWVALRQLCEQGGLDMAACEDGIRLSPGCGVTRSPATIAGPVMIFATRVYHQRSIEFTQGSLRNSDFGVQLSASPEPKIKLMPGAASLRLTSAVDDRGNSLLCDGPAAETYGGASPYWTFTTRLRYPERAGTKIQRIGGVLSFVAASRFQTVALTDIGARNVVTVSGPSKLIIRHITQTGDRYEVSLAAVAPLGDPAEFNRLQQLLYSADVRLLDANGQSILKSAGPNFIAADSPNALELSIIFDRNLSDGRPAPAHASKLLWQIPVETKTVELPFEIGDLPMP